MKFLASTLICLTSILPSLLNAEVTKIVMIYGMPSHASGQHEFRAGVLLLAHALEKENNLSIQIEMPSDYGWPKDESIFRNAKSVIIYSDGNNRHPTFGHEKKMNELIEAGMGFMCMHYAVEVPTGPRGDYFKKWLGAHYESGFSANPHWTATTELNPKHPISHGVPSFKANDEWYYNMRFAEPNITESILTAIPRRENINRYVHWNPHAEKGLQTQQVLMWAIERSDGGRGVGFTGGHWHRNWGINEFRTLALNAIVWTAKIEVPPNGVKSDPLNEKQLNQNLDKKKHLSHVNMPCKDDFCQAAAKPISYRWPGQK